jgi:hypothetical protein
MLGELFYQVGTQMLQKINDPIMKMEQLVLFKGAVLNKLFRNPELLSDVKLQPEFSNLIYFKI